MEYLSHIIFMQDIQVDPKKIEAMEELLVVEPNSLSNLEVLFQLHWTHFTAPDNMIYVDVFCPRRQP